MCLTLLPGCQPCGIRFFRFPEESDRHFASVSHRTVVLFRLRESSYTPVAGGVNVVTILEQFRHQPRLGQHKCLKCGVFVTVRSRISLEGVAKELAAHLQSREHESLRFKAPVERTCHLPPKTVPLDFHRYICYGCDHMREFDSFLIACEHADEVHALRGLADKPTRGPSNAYKYGFTSPLPDYMEVTEDGWSRLCKLCNVVVWSEDDPHLTGKRHRKAIDQLPVGIVCDDSDLL